MNQQSQGSVLLVDDEPFVLESLQRALGRETFEIETCCSGQEALALLESRHFDVIVSDEMMPGMRGSELLAEVRQKWPGVVRITLTGQASMEAAIRLINEGAIYRFLTKPCNAVDLAQTIRQAMQLQELSRQSSKLLSLAQQQREVIDTLENEYPGISAIERLEDGTIVLDDVATADIDLLTGRIRSHVQGRGASG